MLQIPEQFDVAFQVRPVLLEVSSLSFAFLIFRQGSPDFISAALLRGVPPILFIFSDQGLDTPSLHFQFGVVQGMTNSLLVGLAKPSLTRLIFVFVHDEVVSKLGCGFHPEVNATPRRASCAVVEANPTALAEIASLSDWTVTLEGGIVVLSPELHRSHRRQAVNDSG